MKKIIMLENQEFFSDVKIGAHHYAELFAKNGYKVLWISPAFSSLHKLNKNINIKERERLNNENLVELKDNIYGYSPKVILPFVKVKPFNSKVISKIYLRTSFPSIKKVLKKNDFYDADILWISNIKMLYLKDMIKYKNLIYRVADEKKGFKDFFKTLQNMEEELIKKADIVFATAHNIMDKCKEYRNDVYYLPNGVVCEDFICDDESCPEDIKDIKDQINCIYIGAIAEWIDFEMVRKFCIKNKNINFLFIGPKHVDFTEIEKIENVRYLGKKNYLELKQYLNYSKIAWIPFKKNKLTDAINPVKLYEYLAAGVPTVVTNFKEINYIDGPFEKVKNIEELDEAVKRCLCGKYKKDELIQYSQENTWKKRFDYILECIKRKEN